MGDSLAALVWLSRQAQGHKVVVWGHSMGAAVAGQVMARSKVRVHTLVLESPFNNLAEEVHQVMGQQAGGVKKLLLHLLPLSKLLRSADLSFRTDRVLASVKTPVLILHAEDDATIRLELSRKLLASAREGGKQDIRMEEFGADLGLGHNNIYRADKLRELLRVHLGLGDRPEEEGTKLLQTGVTVSVEVEVKRRSCEPRGWPQEEL